MGLKFASTRDGQEVNWNLTFGYDNALWTDKYEDVRDVTYAYLNAVDPELAVTDENYVISSFVGTVIRRPSEQFNKETARIYAILAVLENAGVTSHDEKSEFFEAYRQAKAGSGKPSVLDVYVSE